MNVARIELVDHLFGEIAEHEFRADIEQLDDAFFIGRNNREIGAGKDRVLQRARLQQRLLALRLDAVGAPRLVEGNGAGGGVWHKGDLRMKRRLRVVKKMRPHAAIK